MERHEFLSPAWIAAARALREAARGDEPAPEVSVRMNLLVHSVPGRDASLEAHLDTSGGTVDLELGLLDSPDVRVSLDYDTARAILVEGNGEAAMQAFLAGRVRVEGDMTKLLQFQAVPLDPSSGVAAEIRAMTV